MSDAFSTPADHVLSHPELEEILKNAQAGPSSMGDGAEGLSIEEAFEVDETVRRVLEGGYKTVSSNTYTWKSYLVRDPSFDVCIEKWDVMKEQLTNASYRLDCNSPMSSCRLRSPSTEPSRLE